MIESSLPWTEKYRPKNLEEISSHKKNIKILNKMIETKNIPHLLFHGPAGTGKTSTILAIARKLFGLKLFKSRILELNASDERGINVIRTKIKNFAGLSISLNENVPSFKLIILDEADWMTKDAQNALRRIMEKFSDITRFCLICNYVTKIIPPIASRCAKFHFKPLEQSSQITKLEKITKIEQIKTSKEVLETINHQTEGDLRRGINLLQSCCQIFGEKTTKHDVLKITPNIPKEIITNLIEKIQSENLDDIKEIAEEITKKSFSSLKLLVELSKEFVKTNKLSDLQKIKILTKLSESECNLRENADSFFQILDVLCYINSIYLN